MRCSLLGLALVLAACPERQVPERGLQLVYRKPGTDSIRSVVDRRLAQLKLRAHLSEDATSLTVRVPEGADVSRLKALFAQRGHLEFCAEDAASAARWCALTWPAGVTPDNAGTTCTLRGAHRQELEASLADAGTEVAWGSLGKEAVAYAISRCLSPRIVAAEVTRNAPNLMLDFDRAGAADFAALTKDAVGRRLVIRLEGVVTSAPIVMEPITGGRAMLTTGFTQREPLEVLAAALVGGSLPAMELVKEEAWGPPSFKR